jgi:NADH:ubiquinone oxidoreductase subunit K
VFFVLVVAAAEVVVGLAIIVAVFRTPHHDVDDGAGGIEVADGRHLAP